MTKAGREPPRSRRATARAAAFVGRRDDLSEAARRLSQHRLVTLVGAGGAGKTRLAQRTRELVRGRYPDGAWVVECAERRGAALAEKVAGALDLRALPGASVEESLVRGIGERRALLVLDACEHALDEVVRLVSALRAGCPRLALLATSRAPLGLPGESVYRVDGLAAPDGSTDPADDAAARFDAVRLFVDRLDAEVDRDGVACVGRVCRRLDGLPLAIEIAAARARTLGVDRVAAMLAADGGGRPALALDELVRWSYGQLDPAARATLRASTVFADGWTLPALASVLARASSGAAPDAAPGRAGEALESLVQGALVVRQGRRYRLLDTVRQAVRAGVPPSEAAALPGAHARWYAEWARRRAPALLASRQIEAMRLFEADDENLRAAQAHLIEARDAERAQRLVASLALYRENRGLLREGAERGLEALALGEADATLPAAIGTARLLLLGGDGRASGLYEEARLLARRRGDALAEADAEQGIGNVVFWQRDVRSAEAHYHEAYALRRERGDLAGTASSLHSLGNVRLRDGRLLEAKALFEEAIAIRRELGDARGLTMVFGAMSQAALARDEYDEAERLARETVSRLSGLRLRWVLALTLSTLARVEEHRGDLRRAARLAGARARVREITGFPVPEAERADLAASLGALRARLGEAAFDEAYGEGYSKDWNGAVALASG